MTTFHTHSEDANRLGWTLCGRPMQDWENQGDGTYFPCKTCGWEAELRRRAKAAGKATQARRRRYGR